jgi:hypothetical protein
VRTGVLVFAILTACVRPASTSRTPVEPLPSAPFAAAEARAAAIVPDPRRGGPPIPPGASPLPPFTGVDRATARYVGPEACATCHPQASATWSASAHAHALTTLREHESAADPACFTCHVTGFEHPGGYAGAATPALGAVTCEACHGPGSAHVAAPDASYGKLPAEQAACVACHTHDTAPDFRFPEWWARVAH